MELLEYRKSYQEYKAELDNELAKSMEGFVRIGYLLKVARDTNILAESGYATVTEFAQKEYGLDKSQVSRFIQINDRFGKDGYSDQLEDHYKGFGYAKLVLMLQLPDSLNEELTADYTKSEIQTIKEELDEEKKISDIEVMLEGEHETTAVMETDLDKTIKQLGQDEPEVFEEIYNARQQDWSVKNIQSIMVPAGQKIYGVRIRGIGRKELLLKDKENGNEVVLIDLRSGEKTKDTWEELLGVWENLFSAALAGEHETLWDYKALWEKIYMMELPVPENPPHSVNTGTNPKSEVAPVQPKEKRKDSKVTKAKVDKPNKIQRPEPEVAEPEEQLPGQTSFEDFPEVMPESTYQEINEEECKPVMEPNVMEENVVLSAVELQGRAGDIWSDILAGAREIRQFTVAWQETEPENIPIVAVQDAYRNAVDMAAGLEKLMILLEKGGRNE